MSGALRRAVEAVCAALMAAITGVVFLQVVSRYVFQHPFDWPEELARYLFVWVALLGAALALERSAHFSIDVFTARLRRAAASRLAAALDALFCAFALILTWQGAVLTWSVSEQPSAAMEISMAWPYAAVPVAAALMAVTLGRSALRRLRT